MKKKYSDKGKKKIKTHKNLHKYIPSEQFRDNIFEKGNT